MTNEFSLSTGPITFPPEFGWGVATASYQIEGAVKADGRGQSIWDTFSHLPGKILDGTNGDRASDHYNLWRQDVDQLADLGVRYYRFSLAWPRIQPDGRGPANQKGLDFYKRLTQRLLDKGIIPWVTLYHWDLPQALEDAGGWPSRDTAQRLADFGELAFAALGDQVDHWTTLNEPYCTAFLGYADGEHAPGRQEPAAALAAMHHLLLGHGLTIERWAAARRSGQELGITLNFSPPLAPEDSDTPEVRDAIRRYDAIANRAFLNPLVRGEYPADLVQDLAPLTDFGFVREGDMALIAQPMDALGVNYYNRLAVLGVDPAVDRFAPGHANVGAADVVTGNRGRPVTGRNWPVDPEGLIWLTKWLTDNYDLPPLWVTENGSAWEDRIAPDGAVHDPARVAFLEAHARAIRKILDLGIDLRGYFVWTPWDNFEWAFGESSRFGLVYVDYETQQRTEKDSFHWYKALAASGSIPDDQSEA
ncbi:MAG: beta-glucosidase [Bifidobacteriaceae bacterium]|jgi:beta-glucosidase|nr:beta-glucosidase [Bifidobacteriaceae bacterium]